MTDIEAESGLVRYAREELELAGLFDGDGDYGGMIGDHVMRIVETFAAGGHSGMSASITISVLEKVLRYEPLTPLTYAEDEWIDQSDMSGTPMWQNRRKHDVFSEDHGVTWYCLDGTVGRRRPMNTNGPIVVGEARAAVQIGATGRARFWRKEAPARVRSWWRRHWWPARIRQLDRERADWKRWHGDLDAQIRELADVIMHEIPGEPSADEGPVACAIRLLRER